MPRYLANLLRRYADPALQQRNHELTARYHAIYNYAAELEAQLRQEMIRQTRPPGAYVTWRHPREVLNDTLRAQKP